jgi:hypothetical protein
MPFPWPFFSADVLDLAPVCSTKIFTYLELAGMNIWKSQVRHPTCNQIKLTLQIQVFQTPRSYIWQAKKKSSSTDMGPVAILLFYSWISLTCETPFTDQFTTLNLKNCV